ncbi:MAG TPA: calcium-binding protein, partial [Thermodesulfobacteriota bacterium]|nr:calcium-binding protein [Thermodesulfobacteriota bacterium]
GDDGDDAISTDSNGSGWLYGGEGLDIIDAGRLDNSIIEGGPGSDILIGGINGNAQLFGESYGEMADLIAAGETAPDSGVRGDIVAADGANNNFLFGSNGYDIMFGSEAKDVIVAGA